MKPEAEGAQVKDPDDSDEIDLSKVSVVSSTGEGNAEESSLAAVGIEEDELGWGYVLGPIVFFLLLLRLCVLLTTLGALFSDAGLAIAFRGWLTTYWPLLLLYFVPITLGKVARVVFLELQKIYDHKWPDNMDVHTGHWLETRLDEIGLAREIRVGGASRAFFGGRDAYDPGRDIVFLADITYHKKDPTFWAIGAHELGHVIVHREHKIWSKVSLFMRRFYKRLFSFVPLWAVIAALLASELAATLFFVQLGAAIVCGLFVCIDEWWASAKALAEMHDDDRVQQDAVSDTKRLLLAAFSTYASPLVVMMGVGALARPIWDLLTSGTFQSGPPLEGSNLLIAQGMGITLIGIGVASVVQVIRSKPKTQTKLEDLDFKTILLAMVLATVGGLVLCFFFAITWDASNTAAYTLALFLAAPRLQFVFGLFVGQMNIVSALVGWAIKLTINAPQEAPKDGPKITSKMQRFDLLTFKRDLVQQAQSFWIPVTPVPLVILWFLL